MTVRDESRLVWGLCGQGVPSISSHAMCCVAISDGAPVPSRSPIFPSAPQGWKIILCEIALAKDRLGLERVGEGRGQYVSARHISSIDAGQ